MSDQTNELFKETNSDNTGEVKQTETKTVSTESAGTPASTNEIAKTMLQLIVNEKGEPKYKSEVDAIKALYYSQDHIKTIERDNQELRKQLELAAKEKEEISQVREYFGGSENQTGHNTTNVAPALDAEKVAQMVQQELSAQRQEDKFLENINYVGEALIKEFGGVEPANKILNQRALELGMTVEEIKADAARNPKKALELLGVGKRKSVVSPTPSGGFSMPDFGQENNYVQSNSTSVLAGASSQKLIDELAASAKMAEQLGTKGMSVNELVDPKKYFKVFPQA